MPTVCEARADKVLHCVVHHLLVESRQSFSYCKQVSACFRRMPGISVSSKGCRHVAAELDTERPFRHSLTRMQGPSGAQPAEVTGIDDAELEPCTPDAGLSEDHAWRIRVRFHLSCLQSSRIALWSHSATCAMSCILAPVSHQSCLSACCRE